MLHARLADVVAAHFEIEYWVDDNMRTIPDHYHAHARPRGGPFCGRAAPAHVGARGRLRHDLHRDARPW